MRLILLALLVFVSFPIQAQSDEPSLYRYLYQVEQSLTIRDVDLLTAVDTLKAELAIPSEFAQLRYVFPSDDGKNALLVFDNGKQIFVMVNLENPQIEVLPVTGILSLPYLASTSIEVPYQDVAWSSDSQYVAISVIDPSDVTNQMKTYVYYLESHRLKLLTAADWTASAVNWSPDGKKLAVVERMNSLCNPVCYTHINIYDPDTLSVIQSVNIGSHLATSDFGLCDLKWNSDGTLLSFISNCDATFIGDRGIYVLNLLTEELDTVDETVTEPFDYGPLTVRFYRSIWINDDLFVNSLGVTPEVQPALIRYRQDQAMRMNAAVAIKQWTVSPDSTRVVYTTGAHPYENVGYEDHHLFVAETSDLSNAIAQATDGLQVTTAAVACDFEWSPGEKVISYAIPHSLSCMTTAAGVHAIAFVDASISEQIYIREAEADEFLLFPVGWVK